MIFTTRHGTGSKNVLDSCVKNPVKKTGIPSDFCGSTEAGFFNNCSQLFTPNIVVKSCEQDGIIVKPPPPENHQPTLSLYNMILNSLFHAYPRPTLRNPVFFLSLLFYVLQNIG